MARTTKPRVEREETFDKLDIRLGRIVQIEDAPGVLKPAYKLTIEFGHLGRRTSVGRFTQTPRDELLGRQIVGILNFEPRKVGATESQLLVLGVQYPKADSQEATPLVPLQLQPEIDEAAREPKPIVDKQETFDRLEMRLGRVLEISDASAAIESACELRIDFGKFGPGTGVARFTQTPRDDLVGRLVVGILNLEPHQGKDEESRVDVFSFPFPDAESEHSTPLVPLHPQPKIGGKVF